MIIVCRGTGYGAQQNKVTHVRQKAVQRLASTVVSHGDGVEVVLEPDCWNDPPSRERQRYVALE